MKTGNLCDFGVITSNGRSIGYYEVRKDNNDDYVITVMRVVDGNADDRRKIDIHCPFSAFNSLMARLPDAVERVLAGADRM